jgi:hypothetical protein
MPQKTQPSPSFSPAPSPHSLSCEHSQSMAPNTPTTTPATTWSPQQAANYLDSRELWWQQWPCAQKDHGTLCISCHTNLPYALERF